MKILVVLAALPILAGIAYYDPAEENANIIKNIHFKCKLTILKFHLRSCKFELWMVGLQGFKWSTFLNVSSVRYSTHVTNIMLLLHTASAWIISVQSIKIDNNARLFRGVISVGE